MPICPILWKGVDGNFGVRTMKTLRVLVAALGLACIAGGAVAQTDSQAKSQDELCPGPECDAVEVVAQSASRDRLVRRGGYAGTIPFTTIEQGVRVIRGHLPEPASGRAPVVQAVQPRIQPLGGGTFVDNETQRVVSCFRRRTTQVGIIRLVCLNRRF